MSASMNRIQAVVVPILRGDPRLDGVTITTWVPDVDYRTFPMINVRRFGGTRNPKAPKLHSLPVIEMSVYSNEDLIQVEELYETALDVLYDAEEDQTWTPAGYIQNVRETMGATQFSSLYQDSWRTQGLIRIAIRKPRSSVFPRARAANCALMRPRPASTRSDWTRRSIPIGRPGSFRPACRSRATSTRWR